MTSATHSPASALLQQRPEVAVEQGPEWLARLLYAPPETVARLVVVAVLVGMFVVAWLFARADVDAEAVSEISVNVSVLFVAGVVTWGVTGLDFPYLVDVAIGAGAGIGVGYGLVGPVSSRLCDEYMPQ